MTNLMFGEPKISVKIAIFRSKSVQILIFYTKRYVFINIGSSLADLSNNYQNRTKIDQAMTISNLGDRKELSTIERGYFFEIWSKFVQILIF